MRGQFALARLAVFKRDEQITAVTLPSQHLAAGPELERHNCGAERSFYDLELTKKKHLVKMSTM